MQRCWVIPVLAFAGCGRIGFGTVGTVDTAAPADSIVDQPFGPAMLRTDASVVSVNDDDPCLSEDGLQLLVATDRTDLSGKADIFQLVRASPADSFGGRVLLVGDGGYPTFSEDMLQLYFSRTNFIYVWTRTTTDVPFDPTTESAVATLNTAGVNNKPGPTFAGSLQMIFERKDSGTNDRNLYIAERPFAYEYRVGNIRPLDELNSSASEEAPYTSPDGLVVYFSSDRTGNLDLYRATRHSLGDSFDPPVPVSELNTMANEQDPHLPWA